MSLSLRSKFLIYIVLPVIVALLALTAVSYLSARHYLFQEMKKSGIEALKADAEDMSRRVVRLRTMLQSLALADQIGGFDDEQRRRIFLRLEESLGDRIISLYMGCPDGRLIRSRHRPLPKDYDPRTRPWYRGALLLPAGVSNGTTVSYADAVTGRLVVALFQQVMERDGTLRGVLGLKLDVVRMAEQVKSIAGLPPNGIRFLVNDNTRILIHPDTSRINTLLSSSTEPMDIRMAEKIRAPEIHCDQYFDRRAGQKWYMGFHHVTGTHANIVLMAPAKAALRPLTQLIWIMSLLSFVFIVIIVGVILVMTRRMSKPIFTLIDTAVKIVEEDRHPDPPATRRQDELGRLTQAFDIMKAGLRQRDFIRDAFDRYVTEEVARTLLDQPGGLRLGGIKKEVTIMFCDIRGFTPLSENLAPELVLGILNRYLGKMSALVADYGGTVSEFVGDSVLAFFGAPVEHTDSPLRAVTCAVAMQQAMTAFNRNSAGEGLPELSIGIGINTGEVVVGNIGSRRRVKYGAVGYALNLTARVEAAARGGQILITDTTRSRVGKRVSISGERRIHLKGVTDAVRLYNVSH